MTHNDIVDTIHEVRQLVEEVLDVSTITDEKGHISRTNEGLKLARVLFGLDIIRKGIKDCETRNR